jgi:hypothetical protein
VLVTFDLFSALIDSRRGGSASFDGIARVHGWSVGGERALGQVGGRLRHVATSARDVRGALEAGVDVVERRRPGHRLDPDGPAPQQVAADLAEVRRLLDSGDNRGTTPRM